ncbi:MAG: hypothetical protein MI867_09290 [Pseudomonadales bacterium]|nr:hypothetical protein [Pseudomonadales bacterium]
MNSLNFQVDKVESPFEYDAQSILDAWPQVHSIDQEPLPCANTLDALLNGSDLSVTSPSFGDDTEALSEHLMSGWVDFHNGDFQGAYEKAVHCGPAATYLALMALNTYASYLAPEKERADLLLAATEEAKKAIALFPGVVNIEYAYAINIGRYSETVSIAKAITTGAALNFKKSLDTCLSISPKHVPSLLALGALHAQAIDAIGELAARMSFGATKKKVFKTYEEATKLPNPPPVIFVEYAKNTLLLEKKNKGMVERLLKQALAAPVLDPLDAFDQQEAVELLETL